MADTPIWVQLLVPVITGLTGWATSKLELLSFDQMKQYKGIWYAYYRDPDTHAVQEELWEFNGLGRVGVSRNNAKTFTGKLSLSGRKAYMQVTSVKTGEERLLVMLDKPRDPARAADRPVPCLWLGEDGSALTTAGHGWISRRPLKENAKSQLKDEFIRADLAAPAAIAQSS